MTVANTNANNCKISTIPKQCHPAAIIQMVMDGLRCPVGNATRSECGRRPRLLVYFNLSSLCVRSFVRLLVRGIKNGHLIGRRNDVTANMAALAPRSQPSLRHSAPLSLGLPGSKCTCADVFCYCLVRGNSSSY